MRDFNGKFRCPASHSILTWFKSNEALTDQMNVPTLVFLSIILFIYSISFYDIHVLTRVKQATLKSGKGPTWKWHKFSHAFVGIGILFDEHPRTPANSDLILLKPGY